AVPAREEILVQRFRGLSRHGSLERIGPGGAGEADAGNEAGRGHVTSRELVSFISPRHHTPHTTHHTPALHRNVCAMSVQLPHPSLSKTHTLTHTLTHRHCKGKHPKALWRAIATTPYGFKMRCCDESRMRCKSLPP